MRPLKALAKFLIALLILPVCIGFTYSFAKLLGGFHELGVLEYIFLSGIGAYILFELIFSKPLRTYVLGHELAHVLASMMFGGMPKKFKVSKKGGSVTLTKTNFVVSLAPYLFPIYTVFVLLAYGIIKRFYPVEPYYPYVVALVGFSLAFHVRLTFFAIRQGQPDLKTTGVFFSLVLITMANLIVLSVALNCLFPAKIYLTGFFKDCFMVSKKIYIWVLTYANTGLALLIEKLQSAQYIK